MTTNATTRISRPIIPGLGDEDGGIFSTPGVESIEPVARALLLPEEEQLSLPQTDDDAEYGPITPLTQFLGPQLTVANPAWAGDPVPQMRALQKRLVEYSLTLEQDDRTDCMDAIVVIENAVQLRLRLQQMRMNEIEREIKVSTGRTS